MAVLWLDLETYSPVPIAHGTFAYSERAEILLLSWAIDDGRAHVWDLTEGTAMPGLLEQALVDPDVPIVAHNAQFDAVLMANALNSSPLMTAAGTTTERWRCTMAQALSHSLPGSLDALCVVLGVPTGARKIDGRSLINLFCKPDKHGERVGRLDRPSEWAEFVAYAQQDIVAMRACAKLMPDWNWRERDQALWHLDQRINRRGFAVDVELAQAAIKAVSAAGKRNADRTNELTDGAVERVTQRDRLLKHLLEEHGVELPDMRTSTLERRLQDENLAEGVRELIRLRLSGAKNSTSKYRTLVRSVSSDGRLRGTVQFRGASRTGRDAGRIFQPQNLPRPASARADIAEWIELVKTGTTYLLGLDDVQLASDALRGCIIAPPGRKLVQADFSNIEGRIVAWLAGEDWKLDAFRAFDRGEGEDLYRLTYARAFGGGASTVTEDQRQLGKVVDLAGAYQGWTGACHAFCDGYGIEYPGDDEAGQWMAGWRDAHPAIRAFWPHLDDCIRFAIRHPGQIVSVGAHLRAAFRGIWLKIELPSGRILSYPNARIEDGSVVYAGFDTYTRKWTQEIYSYGGKWLENATQGIAADLLWHGARNAEAGGYPVILRVHDELVTEVPDRAEYSPERLAALMVDAPAWAAGLPLAAKGFEANRYGK